MGDMPIFVAHDSADVWARRDLFRLREDGEPEVVAGVPPDYFSATGQLWGNPHYRWDALAREGYAWWIARIRAVLAQVDRIRLDHFRGFEASWEVPGGRDDGDQRAVGEGAGRRAVRGDGGRARAAAVRRGEPWRDHAGSGSAARAIRISRDGDPAVRVRHRSAGAGFQAPQLSARPRRLHRHARQRHHRRLVDQRRRPQHAQRAGPRERARLREALPAHGRPRNPLGLHPRGVRVGGRYRRSCRCRMCWAWGTKAG